MKRLVLLIAACVLLLGQHRQVVPPTPVLMTDSPATSDVEFLSPGDIEIHLDEGDVDCIGAIPCELQFYDGDNTLIGQLVEAGDFWILGELTQDGSSIFLDNDNTGVPASGAGLYFSGAGPPVAITYTGGQLDVANAEWSINLDGYNKSDWYLGGGGGDGDELYFEAETSGWPACGATYSVHADANTGEKSLDFCLDSKEVELSGTQLRLDQLNTSAPADGAGIIFSGEASDAVAIEYDTTDSTLDFIGADSGYSFDEKIEHPATRKIVFTGDMLSSDGVVCNQHAAGLDLTSTSGSSGGPAIDTAWSCNTGANNGYLYGHTYMPSDYDPSVGVFFRAVTMNDNASPSGLLRGVMNVQCVDIHDGDETASGSWTAYSNMTTGYNTQYNIEPFWVAGAITPDGGCEVDDLLLWRMVLCQTTNDNCAAASTTQLTDVHYLAIRMEYATTGAE